MATQGGITIRPLTSQEDFLACMALQRATWGELFMDCVPPMIMNVAQRIGGVAAGAFDSDGKMLGFVFGLAGVKDGEPIHWSDMLAVVPEARNLGIGRMLKQYQAERAREVGAKRIYWTFDPLVARNAHLNLNKLGARVVEYVPDMYGETSSELHRIGTDRFIVAWDLDSPGAQALAAAHASAGHDSSSPAERLLNAQELRGAERGDAGSYVSSNDDTSNDVESGDVGVDRKQPIRVVVPRDIESLQRESLEEARLWRRSTREEFMAAEAAGYRVVRFVRASGDELPYYELRHWTTDGSAG